MVKIVEIKPDASVTKRCICRNCGVTLEYVPADIRKESRTDYTGCTDIWRIIDCPNCSKEICVG